jgi:acyl-CoA thioester hydrolase
MFNLEEEKLKFRFKMNLDVRWSDMDEMHHVNNSVYLTYFEQARLYYLVDAVKLKWEELSFILASAHIDYVKPMVFPNAAYVYLRINKFGNKSFEMRYLVTSLVNGVEELSASGYTTLVAYNYSTGETIVVPESVKERIRNYEPEKI